MSKQTKNNIMYKNYLRVLTTCCTVKWLFYRGLVNIEALKSVICSRYNKNNKT